MSGTPGHPGNASFTGSNKHRGDEMRARESILDLKGRMSQSIIGQEQVVERLLLTLLCNGNVLVEGLSGLSKTRAVKALAKNLKTEFSRIQFTPDLLPSDFTGSEQTVMSALHTLLELNHRLRIDAGIRPAPDTLNQALTRAARMAPHDALVVVISDFFGVDEDRTARGAAGRLSPRAGGFPGGR